ncbi:MAG: class I SAM-dependent methyltransferase [Pseudomonadota bacterium]
MTDSQLATWRSEANAPFEGWDFSHLKGRRLESALPWSFASLAREYLRTATHVLDMDTGGGERLLALKDNWAPHMSASEGYPPNVELAKKRLDPEGVDVRDSGDGLEMPFEDNEFDLILNRHGFFNLDEIRRTLVPGGIFLTQQVDGQNMADLAEAFDVSYESTYSEDEVCRNLEAQGFDINRSKTHDCTNDFTDVGAIVYLLTAIPWVVPGFTVDSHAHHLHALQSRLEQTGALRFHSRYFLVIARAPD